MSSVVQSDHHHPFIIPFSENQEGDWADFMHRWREWRRCFDRHHWPESWQGSSFREGSLIFPSPWSESQLRTRWSVRRGFHFGYVLQEGSRRALLMPGYLGAGHEIEAVYLLEDQTLLHLPCSLAGPQWFVQILNVLLPEVLGVHAPDPLWPQRPLVLRMEGHPNFAHCLLNTYTCLERTDATELGRIEVIGMQPFGPLEEIFPDFAWASSRPDGETEQSVFDLPLSQRPTEISIALRRRLLDYARRRLGRRGKKIHGSLDRLRQAGHSILWVSLKQRGAYAINLEKMIVAWMTSLRGAEVSPVLVLDGFSLQHGQTLKDELYGTTIENVIQEEKKQARRILQMIRAAGLNLNVVSCVGLTLLESIHLAGWSDFYVCHQGTVQHKIGWLQSGIEGVVHSSSVRNRGGLHPWGGLGGVAPSWLPSEWIDDLGADPSQPRQPYALKEERIGECVDFLNSLLLQNLSDAQARDRRTSPLPPP